MRLKTQLRTEGRKGWKAGLCSPVFPVPRSRLTTSSMSLMSLFDFPKRRGRTWMASGISRTHMASSTQEVLKKHLQS